MSWSFPAEYQGTATPWFANEPAPVRGVLWLASIREDGRDVASDEIMGLFLDDAQQDTVREIAAHLGWIYRLETDSRVETLSDYYEQPVSAIHADRACDRLAAELRAAALLSAQLVASTLGRAA